MEEKTQSEIMALDIAKLAEFSNMGMKNVDPADIRPPKILLMQKSSNLDDFVAKDGSKPKYGQFFNTGTMEIFDTFDCYFLMATKGTFIKKETNETQAQYIAIGVMAENPSVEKVFGFNFRSSGVYALSPLFTAAKSNRMPMFAIRTTIESKELTNAKGQSWRVPVVRVGEFEKDPAKLNILYELAKGFDNASEKLANEVADEDIPF